MQDFGHWAVFEETDIKNHIGFVYVITFEDGKKYVGAKKIWKRIKAAPCTFKRGPKKGFEESDWKTYTSSSNELNAMIEKGISPKEYLIVGWYPTWGKTLMAEMEMQLANDVLRDPMWLNKQIGGHFNPNCFDDLTADEVGKYIKSGWQFGRSKTEKHSVTYNCSKFTIWDYQENKAVEVLNQNEFARNNDLSSNHLTRLLQGTLDLIKDRWGLPPDIARQRYKFQDVSSGTKFLSNSELEEFYGMTRGQANKAVKDGRAVKLVVESKEDHIKKLGSIELVKTEKTKVTSQVMLNSFKDIVNPMTTAEKSEMIEWLESYITYLKS
ncbi:homing endonuclease [Escherichia phage vB_EcoM_005]|uniref:Putative endonuclease SegE-like GIY-YIG domain-containing protein n=1 Tax=Escherichia phage vB_EcoM_005 TaxID=2500761 RepID=A0A3T0IM07_9CAUD|nr:homing endonuclease [Escherichia phage vB_EcoM_005]AZV01039.1 hypothetical protein vBEcoM005_152 [Escherichia phage vB_EcoM_005]